MTHQQGFSLIELMCVLAIMSLLAALGSAHFLRVSQHTQDKNTLILGRQYLADALTQARQLAVVSGKTSFLCGGLVCDGRWSSGFTLYQTDSVQGRRVVQEHVYEALLQVVWQGFPTQKTQIEFQSNGLSGYQNGTFAFCLGAWQADLILNQSGRFYTTDLQKKATGACQ
ncbi:GspH/FimT family pseudopilin [Marinomonas sp. IMCC 4694]|uniref:GspH/FimT family pseudopilin n=1 Tax=Marinomonas sp. IMCC 4694 TaxID=2605432 RepID=UPI0011E79372|nr:GspH/FimT family pseudopilin [Marinomonas sp. IMCC 4694]TYL47575.1 prepilin-type N-terminal cleavage/methylation domain-containing protein [Marinomonas sp. IMCC 4694]